MELSFLSKCNSICVKSVRDTLDGHNLKSSFETYQSQPESEEKHVYLMKSNVEVSK